MTEVANSWGAPPAEVEKSTGTTQESSAKGTVQLNGSGVKIFLTRSGRNYNPGSLSVGRYRVDVQFDGAERFNIGSIDVREGQTHVINCNAMMMSCSL